MKKIVFLSLFLFSASAFAAPTFQIGGDFVVPYRSDNPSGRLGSLVGGHVQAATSDFTTVDFTALFGLEDKGFSDKPIYLVPGMSLYLPDVIVQPYLSANVPILINTDGDIGIQGAGGLQLGIFPGLALRYSVDIAYYFDSEATIINWVHAGVALSF